MRRLAPSLLPTRGLALGAALALALAAGAQPLAAQSSRSDDGSALGLSGKLRAAIVGALEGLELPHLSSLVAGAQPGRYRWVSIFGGAREPAAGALPSARLLGEPIGVALLGEPASGAGLLTPQGPGIWRLETDRDYATATGARSPALSFITRVPFSQKEGTHLNGYHIGRYPAEGGAREDTYAPPEGFIEVTLENQDFQVSEHFRLRQFLTKDQRDVWPKYLVLDLKLIDKLELVLQELNAMGVRADRMHVMSGYRTPQYNGPGGNGRAKLSRHTYGDAADVWVDNDGNGYMDDLNGDGRADLGDAEVMLRAVDRVEAKYPELVGGAGVYVATLAHGPFIHIDTRGQRSRW